MERSEATLRAREGGFSLVELMVVIAIIGLLSTIVAMNVFGQARKAKVEKARADLHMIDEVIQLFRLDRGRIPDSLDDLVAQPGPEGHEAYLDAGRGSLRDPWKRTYLYDPSGGRGRRPYSLGSYGADGAPGGEAENADLFPFEEEGS